MTRVPPPRSGRRSVLVTGAAHGIGRASAELFARDGWRVGLYDVDAQAAADVAAATGSPHVVAGHLDVTDAAQWDAVLAAFTAGSDGRLDVLVNNAGVLVAGAFAELPVAAQRRVVEVNLLGVVHGCAAAFPYLRAGSCVVNVASASALYGQPGLAAYSASKAAVCALTEALDLEWEPHGIRVVDLLPLYVETGMAELARGTRSAQTLGVRLAPADVAAAVLLAVADRSRVRGPHRAVGRQARLLAATARLGPQALRRSLVARLAR